MKYLYFLVLVQMLFVHQLSAQSNASCCQASSIKAFTDLANDITFVMTHEEPLPFTLENPKGKNITYPVSGGEDAKGYYIAGKKNNSKWIFVFQEWWGLNDYIRLQADMLHASFPNAHILAVDLYDGKVATTREEAGALMQGANSERIEKIILAASNYSGAKSSIATIGWCFGGAWSNKAAIMLRKKAAACIMYYGMPVKDETQLSQLSAPVLGIFADQDGWITPKVVSEFKETMIKLKKSVETYGYNADHAFANPSNPKFNKSFSEDAWNKSVAFLKKHL
jgi:carboxymethylenebutenolidase